jgi:serine/threonine protein phosphatase PrpC
LGVFDGHGGTGASEFVRDNLWWNFAVHPGLKLERYDEAIREAFLACDEKFLTQARRTFDSSGTCALVMIAVGNRLRHSSSASSSTALPLSPSMTTTTTTTAAATGSAPGGASTSPAQHTIHQHSHHQHHAHHHVHPPTTPSTFSVYRIVVANAGDCRAIVCHSDGSEPLQLSTDHKVTDEVERKRVLDAGGIVHNDKLFGMLGVSRAIGDRDFKTPGTENALIAEPQIVEHTVEPLDDFVVLATDGIWDVMSNTDVQNMVHDCIRKQQAAGLPVSLQNCAEGLIEEAIRRGSRDDISVVIRIL